MKMRLGASYLVLFAFVYCPETTTAQTVSYTYAREVNFPEYKTYKWVNIEGADTPDHELDLNIQHAIEAQLNIKGLARVSKGDAQLLIAYQASVSRERPIKIYNDWAYGPGWQYGSSYGYSHGRSYNSLPEISTATWSTIYIGNLVLDFYDTAHNDLVWRSVVSKALRFNEGPIKRQQDLDKAVGKLLQPYPPRTTTWPFAPRTKNCVLDKRGCARGY